MSDFVQRLIRHGYSASEAYTICQSFLKEFTIVELEIFIKSIEKERSHVD